MDRWTDGWIGIGAVQDTKRRWLAREAELKRVVSAAPMDVRPIQPSRAARAVPQSVLQAAEYDRIRRSAPQPLPVADWVGLQLYDSAQQVHSA